MKGMEVRRLFFDDKMNGEERAKAISCNFMRGNNDERNSHGILEKCGDDNQRNSHQKCNLQTGESWG